MITVYYWLQATAAILGLDLHTECHKIEGIAIADHIRGKFEFHHLPTDAQSKRSHGKLPLSLYFLSKIFQTYICHTRL